jgi:hypothetical protein
LVILVILELDRSHGKTIEGGCRLQLLSGLVNVIIHKVEVVIDAGHPTIGADAQRA